ncbi:MAG: transcription-repair coupling factor [Acidobacteria bacterium]|nr:transcription-repair coupling factor [Acidobacteriota bacterium]
MIIPYVEQTIRPLEEHAVVREVLRRLEQAPSEVTLAGLTDTAKLMFTVLAQRALARPVLFVVGSNRRMEALADGLRFFHSILTSRAESAVVALPALDTSPYRELSPHPAIVAARAMGLWKLATGQVDLAVVPGGAFLLRYQERELYAGLARRLRAGDTLTLEELVTYLESAGYERHEPVEMAGQYSIRGGIVDVFSPEAAHAVRLELFGDTLEELRAFDPETQRSVGPLTEAVLLPLTEYPRTQSLLRRLWALKQGGQPDDESPYPVSAFPGWEYLVARVTPPEKSLLQLAPRALVVFDEPQSLGEQALTLRERLEAEAATTEVEAAPRPEELFFPWEELKEAHPRLGLEQLPLEIPGADQFVLASQPSRRFHGAVPAFVEELRRRLAGRGQVLITAASAGEMERLAELLHEYEIPFRFGTPTPRADTLLEEKSVLLADASAVLLLRGPLAEGAVFPECNLAIYGNADLFESVTSRAPARAPSKAAAFAADLGDLAVGDYVVHVDHGIGRYLGLAQLESDGISGEFLLLEYLDGDRLYVPLARLDLVQKYRSIGRRGRELPPPKVDRLGGLTWQRTKVRAERALRDMAEELLKLYAERATRPGHSFSADAHWQREFEDAFEWEDTPDQRQASEEVKRDMEVPRAMDRLVVGDVGFGKTEVAMRAAFKAVADSKQVAVLAPTTVLAFQHYENFRQRFAPFPLRVEMLSRFRTPSEQQKTLEELEAGRVDILIGTHRLLSRDVAFHDLGLVIVDEEQRFGVAHKERLKQLRTEVDVLTLTATPIPRTLQMALAGLRDLSLIETPPKDRLAIQTVVAPWNETLIRGAIEQELAREGQVYFVHDRIESIGRMGEALRKLVPRARLRVAHGRMNERALERIMLDFMQHRTDVLLTTKIIENGLDIPLCNTIIVNRADRYGLAELYQLRGRVGRSNRRAYAYLLVPPEGRMTELARTRLAALKEFSELGASFRIAALDLELRGGGNLLGREQHGHINALGFDLYTQMLERTMRALQGQPVVPEARTTLNLGVDIRIPPDYIEDERQRLRMYKRIATLATDGERAALRQELEDRYGPLPRPVENVLEYAALKTVAERLRIQTVSYRQGEVSMRFHPETRVPPTRLVAFVQATPRAVLEPSGWLKFPLARESGWLGTLRKLLLGLEA